MVEEQKVQTVIIIDEDPRKVYGRVSYDVTYDKIAKLTICTCPAAQFQKRCHHMREFEKMIEER